MSTRAAKAGAPRRGLTLRTCATRHAARAAESLAAARATMPHRSPHFEVTAVDRWGAHHRLRKSMLRSACSGHAHVLMSACWCSCRRAGNRHAPVGAFPSSHTMVAIYAHRYGCDGWTRWVLGFLAIYTWANLHGFPLVCHRSEANMASAHAVHNSSQYRSSVNRPSQPHPTDPIPPTPSHQYIRLSTHPPMRTHARTFAHPRSPLHVRSHVRTHARRPIHARTCARTPRSTHARACTRIHTL